MAYEETLRADIIGAIRTSDIGYTCEEIIDNFLIEGVNSAAVNFGNPIYLVSILNGYVIRR